MTIEALDRLEDWKKPLLLAGVFQMEKVYGKHSYWCVKSKQNVRLKGGGCFPRGALITRGEFRYTAFHLWKYSFWPCFP